MVVGMVMMICISVSITTIPASCVAISSGDGGRMMLIIRVGAGRAFLLQRREIDRFRDGEFDGS